MVIADRGNTFPIRAVGNAVHHALVTVQDEVVLSVFGVPDPQCAILAGRHDLLAVRFERHADDVPGVSTKGVDFTARHGVPDLHGAVRTGGGDPSAIR